MPPKEDELTKLSKKAAKDIAKGLGGKNTLVIDEQEPRTEFPRDVELSDEQQKLYDQLLKQSKIQQEESRETIKLTKEQQIQVDEARKQARGSAAIPTAVPGVPVNVPPNESAVEKAQEDAEAKEEIIEETNEDIEAAVEKEKEHAETKIANIPSVPGGFLRFFANNAVFLILALIDSIVSSVFPIAGDVGMFIGLSVLYLIPCILLFDVAVYVRIFFYLLIDLMVGSMLGTFANGIIPVFGDAIIDFVPEAILLMTGNAPPKGVLETYKRKIPNIIAKIRQQSKIRIAQIRADGKERIKFALAKMRGHFSGVAKEGRKVIFVFLSIAITIAAQVFGLIGIETNGQITFTLILVGLLVLFRFGGILANTEFIGTLAFIAFNALFKYILDLDRTVEQLLPNFGIFVTVGFIVLSGLLMYKVIRPDNMSQEQLMRIMMWYGLIIAAFYLSGYLASGRVLEDVESTQAQQQVRFENFNFIERINLAITTLYERGTGEYVPSAQQEYVREYIGIKLASVESARTEYVSGDPVQFSLYYSTGSEKSIYVGSSCFTGQIYGEISPSDPIPASNLFTPAVTCTFWSLPKGTHYVTINSFYDYQSHVEIPLMFMGKQKYRELSLSGKVDEYQKSAEAPRTSSGPIDFKVYTFKDESEKVTEFKLPLIYDENNLELAPLINVELDNPVGDSRTQGNLKKLNSVVFEVPEGLELGNCNFQKNRSGRLTPTSQNNGRWEYDITEEFDVANPYEKINCRLYVGSDYVDEYLPIDQDVTFNTMHYYINYTYQLEQREIAKVT